MKPFLSTKCPFQAECSGIYITERPRFAIIFVTIRLIESEIFPFLCYNEFLREHFAESDVRMSKLRGNCNRALDILYLDEV